ncbi:MAG: hypothetical protein IJK89_10720 [Clostridia bacterium]|nr:hypothetical protein [Clostridia bacterium]
MALSLNGAWRLYCVEEKKGQNPPFGVCPDLSAPKYDVNSTVPGNCQLDLCRAGLLPEPYFGDNYYQYIPLEHCGWVYEREFKWEGVATEESVGLRFDGIDTIADVFLNGEYIGHAEDMFVEHEFDVTGVLTPGVNRLLVHIFSAVNYARGQDYPVAMQEGAGRTQIPYLRRPAHSFGWDIFPRLMTAGLWRDVTLVSKAPSRFKEVYYAVTEADENSALLRYAFRFTSDEDDLENIVVKVHGQCRDRAFDFEIKSVFTAVNGEYRVRSPYLWWPKGYGDADLYEVTASLYIKGMLRDTHTEHIGLRTVRLERDFTPGSQKFCFYVNGTPIFCKGTNWVPTDAFHSRCAERTNKVLDLVGECGCNIIRLWGGGIYESDAFYSRCDREGILVWQDFAFANTTYPESPRFIDTVADEVTKQIKKVRNHPCLCVYSSDNEVDMHYLNMRFAENYARCPKFSHELIPSLIKQHDPYRYYLKSSPEAPEGFTCDNVPEQHTWGARAYYKDPYYKDSSASFIGEAGFHGCPSPESIRRFIPEDSLYPFINRYYAAHSTEDLRLHDGHGRNIMMTKHLNILFGGVPDTLEEFAVLSQISQAEALKFFIERTRALKWRRTGIIWWNIIDGWPQISDAVVDYYFVKKKAFHYIKASQQPVLALVGELSGWGSPLILSNDTRKDAFVECTVTDYATGETLYSGVAAVPAGENRTLAEIPLFASDKKLLLIDYTVDGKPCFNHYIAGSPPFDPATMKEWAGVIRDRQKAVER